MDPDVTQVYELAAQLLGDPEQEKFTSERLRPGLNSAIEEVRSEMVRSQLPIAERIVTYTLPLGTTELTPLTAGIGNFGELIQMEERTNGSSEDYLPVRESNYLPQRTQDSSLGVFEWRADTWYFVGATTGRQLRITYYDSGQAPESGKVGIDGSLNFLAYRTAAVIGPAYGHDAKDLDVQARGPRSGEYLGGFLLQLIQSMVRAKQRVGLQQPAYRAGASEVRGGTPPLYGN